MSLTSLLPAVSLESFAAIVRDSRLPVMVALCPNNSPTNPRLLALLETWMPQVSGRVKVVCLESSSFASLMGRHGFPSGTGLVLFNQGEVCYQFIGEVAGQELEDVLTCVTRIARESCGSASSPANDCSISP